MKRKIYDEKYKKISKQNKSKKNSKYYYENRDRILQKLKEKKYKK